MPDAPPSPDSAGEGAGTAQRNSQSMFDRMWGSHDHSDTLTNNNLPDASSYMGNPNVHYITGNRHGLTSPGGPNGSEAIRDTGNAFTKENSTGTAVEETISPALRAALTNSAPVFPEPVKSSSPVASSLPPPPSSLPPRPEYGTGELKPGTFEKLHGGYGMSKLPPKPQTTIGKEWDTVFPDTANGAQHAGYAAPSWSRTNGHTGTYDDSAFDDHPHGAGYLHPPGSGYGGGVPSVVLQPLTMAPPPSMTQAPYQYQPPYNAYSGPPYQISNPSYMPPSTFNNNAANSANIADSVDDLIASVTGEKAQAANGFTDQGHGVPSAPPPEGMTATKPAPDGIVKRDTTPIEAADAVSKEHEPKIKKVKTKKEPPLLYSDNYTTPEEKRSKSIRYTVTPDGEPNHLICKFSGLY